MSYSASDFVEDIETILDCFNAPEPDLKDLDLDPKVDELKILAERVSQRFTALESLIETAKAHLDFWDSSSYDDADKTIEPLRAALAEVQS